MRGPHPRLLKLLERPTGFNALVLARVPNQKHSVLRPEPREELAHLVRACQTRFIQKTEVLLFQSVAIGSTGEKTLQRCGIDACFGELTRGAVQSIPQAQTDAAKSIGLGFWGRLAYAILPQALRRMLPAWVNISAEMVKGSTLLSLIGVLDLLLATQQAIARTFLTIEFYTALLAVFFVINFSISRVGAAVERRMAYVRF